MPFQERVQLARAIAAKQQKRLDEVEDWRPLLNYTQGNPLTLTTVVGQALRDELTRKEQIAAYVDQLRRGEAVFADEPAQGRAKSLGASLSYGFAASFSERERQQLALLHFFQGFVDVNVLRWMGSLKTGKLEVMAGMTNEDIGALLDRAAEVGLLTAHGGGYYRIHPALPWYFKQLFDQFYESGDQGVETGDRRLETESAQSPVSNLQSPVRAFVVATGQLGNYFHRQYNEGNRDVIGVLGAEEANLRHARRLAQRHGWWDAVIMTMQGLRTLYGHTGRHGEWARLVDEIVPDFVDPDTDGPLPEREAEWGLVNDYRVQLLRRARQWKEAQHLQIIKVSWSRSRVEESEKHTMRTLATGLHELGQIQREKGEPDCVKSYQEAAELLEHIDDRAAAAVTAFNLGHAYRHLPALRDLDAAERWYGRSLKLTDESDKIGLSGCYGQLGLVAYERFSEARAAGAAKAELLKHLNAALNYYQQALVLLPANAVNDLAVTHAVMGNIYGDAGNLEKSFEHATKSVYYYEQAGDLYWAGSIRRNIAVHLLNAGRTADARAYAEAALRNYQVYGPRAAAEIEKTQRLLQDIKNAA